MKKHAFIEILSPENEQAYSSFYLYLPTKSGCHYSQYRFTYEKNPINESLAFDNGPNDPSNREFYRIREAYIGTLSGRIFTPVFRALQGGEIGFAFREEGAGDFSGGFHGDEVMTAVSLRLNGEEFPLNKPYFGAFDQFSFEETSFIFRCNTPKKKLVLHRQRYTVSDSTLSLSQEIQWLADTKPLCAAFSPMLTAQRLNPMNTDQILTDTVRFYDCENGMLLSEFDTSPYGVASGDLFSEIHCKNTKATHVNVLGKQSGLSMECGYHVAEQSIPQEQIATSLCIRYRKCLDNKIYFNIGEKAVPKAGMVWKSQIYYRLNYTPQQ